MHAVSCAPLNNAVGLIMTTPCLSEAYEQAAHRMLADLRGHLGLAAVEGKQTLAGLSGTDWEIDAKAWLEGGAGFLVVEARRYTTSRLKQEALAAIAYRIQDLGASGGIVVSPLPLQSGAELVARAARIAHVRLEPESTTESYLAEYMGKRFIGVTVQESAQARDSTDAVVIKGPPHT
jgi:hypothetical protein